MQEEETYLPVALLSASRADIICELSSRVLREYWCSLSNLHVFVSVSAASVSDGKEFEEYRRVLRVGGFGGVHVARGGADLCQQYDHIFR